MGPEIQYYDDLATKSYKILKDMILKGELMPGQKLIQEDVARMLGVSRIPLIHAISHLANDNLIDIVPRKGAYVKVYSSEDQLSFFDINSLLSPEGAFLAAGHINEDGLKELSSYNDKIKDEVSKDNTFLVFENNYHFHMCIFKWSGNAILYSLMKKYCGILTYSEKCLKNPAESYKEHKQIISALRNHDGDTSRELMFSHINGGLRSKFEKQLGIKG
jgi:DNA-binding GntR family transcriptional regulator